VVCELVRYGQGVVEFVVVLTLPPGWHGGDALTLEGTATTTSTTASPLLLCRQGGGGGREEAGGGAGVVRVGEGKAGVGAEPSVAGYVWGGGREGECGGYGGDEGGHVAGLAGINLEIVDKKKVN